MKFISKILSSAAAFFMILILFSFIINNNNVINKLRIMQKLLSYIDRLYVEEVELDVVFDGAMHGLLEELDPHSQYIPSEDFTKMQMYLVSKFQRMHANTQKKIIIDGSSEFYIDQNSKNLIKYPKG